MKEQHNKNTESMMMEISNEDYCYLTTTGRVSGNPHEIEIWFGIKDNSLYLLSGSEDKSDWVKNLMKNPSVTVRIAKQIFTGTARTVTDEKEDTMARHIVAEKYQEWNAGKILSDWARTALVVGIDLSENAIITINDRRRT